jgi:uncharacterized protein YrrD
MLRLSSEVRGYAIRARDGVIGKVSDILFDDQTWMMRWVVVDPERWLEDRKVLLPIIALGHLDAEQEEFSVRLSRQQIKDSPDIDSDRSVSRHMEANVYDHYGWTPYWGTGFFMGGGGYLGGAMGAPYLESREHAARGPEFADNPDDAHLRSMKALQGYDIHATDGDIGHLEDFLVEDVDWSIRYLVVNTNSWWLGHKVVASPRIVETIDWGRRLVSVKVDKKALKDCPAYGGLEKIDRDYDRTYNDYYSGLV